MIQFLFYSHSLATASSFFYTIFLVLLADNLFFQSYVNTMRSVLHLQSFPGNYKECICQKKQQHYYAITPTYHSLILNKPLTALTEAPCGN